MWGPQVRFCESWGRETAPGYSAARAPEPQADGDRRVDRSGWFRRSRTPLHSIARSLIAGQRGDTRDVWSEAQPR